MAAKDALAKLTAPPAPVSASIMTVEAVREDGTVNLADGNSTFPGIPCDVGYLDRQAGDRVVVLRWGAGWFVVGKTGPEFDSPGTKVSWGTSAPSGTGWVTGTPWVREGELYLQLASAPPPSSDPRTFSPTSQGAWRDGGRDTDQAPTQGAWPAYPHPYTGAWFYADTVVDGCAGRTVASMQLRIARTGSPHGINGGVRPRLHLINAGAATSSPPSLNSLSSPVMGPSLGLGESEWFTLPDSWAAALADGSAKGVGIEAGVGSDYLICTSTCGQLVARFD